MEVPQTCPYALPGTQTYLVPLLRLVDDGAVPMAVSTGRRRGDREILAMDGGEGGSEGPHGRGAKRSKRLRMADFVLAARGGEG